MCLYHIGPLSSFYHTESLSFKTFALLTFFEFLLQKKTNIIFNWIANILIFLAPLCSDSWYTIGLQSGWLHWIHPRRWTSRDHSQMYKNVQESKTCKERKVRVMDYTFCSQWEILLWFCEAVTRRCFYKATLLKLHNFTTIWWCNVAYIFVWNWRII
jgi:hypothetical protein